MNKKIYVTGMICITLLCISSLLFMPMSGVSMIFTIILLFGSNLFWFFFYKCLNLSKGHLTFGFIALFVSSAYSLFLALRIKTILGVRWLVLSGDNVLNSNGVQLNETIYYFLWFFALSGFFLGIWLIIQNFQKLLQGKQVP